MRRFPRCWSGAVLLALLPAPLAAQDLTGVWRTESGARYVVRQVGDEFCWYFEPNNVFCGRVYGTLIAGSWLDLPTGPYRFSGRLVLRIESPNRFIKVYETMRYGDAIWTREGKTPGPVAAAPPPAPPTPAPAPAPPPPAPGRAPPYETPPGGRRPTRADENGGTKDWTYRAVGEEYRDKVGKLIGFICPPDPTPEVKWRGTYGTGTYTGDSALCMAAVHDGKITRSGGAVTVEIMPGQSSYRGSEQNGVQSANYGSWDISFSFSTQMVDYDRAGGPPLVPAARPPVTSAPRETVRDGGTLGWADPVPAELRGTPGVRIQYTCPPGGQFYGYVWGTDVYTGDSLPCAAAVHAGVITFAAGGTITVEIRPGQASYRASERNGVPSKNFPAYATSFAIVK